MHIPGLAPGKDRPIKRSHVFLLQMTLFSQSLRIQRINALLTTSPVYKGEARKKTRE
jgi:hypothetical protein